MMTAINEKMTAIKKIIITVIISRSERRYNNITVI